MNPTALVPCGGCRRHVRASEPACPFCAHPLSTAAAEGIVPEPAQRLSRAGVLAFAAAFLSTACEPRPPTPPDPPTQAADAGMMQTIYGGPPPAPIPPPQPNDMAVPAYGGPPPVPPTPPPTLPAPTPHARPHADTQPHPIAVPAYGLPPHRDPPPMQRPGGSISTRYGAPPRPDDDA